MGQVVERNTDGPSWVRARSSRPPPDIAPQLALGQREGEDPTAQNFVDDEDESNVDDVPPAPRVTPPDGFHLREELRHRPDTSDGRERARTPAS